MNATDENGASPTRNVVSRLLTGLLEKAGEEIKEGRLTVAKPGDLLDAARMLLELDGPADVEPSDEVGREIVERLGAELGVIDDEP